MVTFIPERIALLSPIRHTSDQRKRVMRLVSNGKNVSIHFRDEELPLLEEFEKWRRDQYFTRSAFVKQCMHKAIKENNPRRYAWTG